VNYINGNVKSGTFFLFVDTIFSLLLGYAFWFILTKITTSEIIGIVSTAVAFSTIFFTVAIIGTPIGIRRFLGKSFADGKLEDVKIVVKAASVLVSIGVLVSSVIVLVMKDWFTNVIGIDFNLLIIIILIILSSSFYRLFRSVLISSLKTKKLAVITIGSGLVKLALGIILATIGMGALGVTIGYASFSIIAASLTVLVGFGIIKSGIGISKINLRSTLKTTFDSSVVNWIPLLIQRVGTNLGIIVVFGTQGANLAGVYFIAFTIVGALTALFTVLLIMTYPVLSGMKDGRKRLSWRVTKISLIFAMPFVSSIIFYTQEILQLFGKDYLSGDLMFQILLLSIFPTIVMTGIYYLVYAYGKYRNVLTIGLASYGLSTILYFVLIPFYGGDGAAISYTIGSLSGFLISLKIAKDIGMRIFWRDLGIILLIPSGLGFLISSFDIHLAVTIITNVVISYLGFLKLGILTKKEIEDTFTILPPKISNPLTNFVNNLGQKLNRDYDNH